MRLRDIVEIDKEGLIADAVNLKMMDDSSKNLELCKGFVFNYDAENQKRSTLGVLDSLRESFHSANSLNVHLMVQDFGKGKSHFALTLANFFKKPADSPEVAGILARVDFATSGKANALHKKLQAYKQRSKPHLVICISGEVATDLNKMLLRGVRQALEENGIRDAIAQHIIEKPLSYLRGLTGEKREQAEKYLEDIGRPYGDLEAMTELLAEEDEYDIIPTVVELSGKLEAYAFNFEYNLDTEQILEDVVTKLCIGEDRRFEGVLIIFDEINAYLRAWLKNSKSAGGAALQNITNVCERNRGKIALLCLAQIKPSLDTQIPYLERKNYERFTTRIELAPSTYEPRASLELVIDNLIKESEGAQWETFRSKWGDTLWRESRNSYDQYITAYSNRNWPVEDFHKRLGLGCYPLHPLTGYLLCNLEFTQGRTAIQFIKEDVSRFIDERPVEENGELQFVRPVQLMDAFAGNFSLQSKYTEYAKAYDSIAAFANADEINMLKAIALYYLCGEKISKPERERHDAILSVITGFSPAKTRELLEKLSQEYQVVYFSAGTNTYRFFTGFNIADLKRKIEEDTENKVPDFNDLLKHCRRNLTRYLGSDTVRADRFATERRVNGADWLFGKEIFTIDQFERVLSSERYVKRAEAGLIAYFIGEYDQDLNALEKEAELILAKAPQVVKERIIIALPNRGTRDLAKVLAMKEALGSKSSREKQEFGAALTELNKQFEEQLDLELQQVFDSCTYTCRIIDKVPRAEIRHIEPIVSKMLSELYTCIPPVESIDKLRIRSTAGSGIISFTSRQLLANDLKEPFPNQSYKSVIDPIFVRSWKLLKAGTPYIVKVPQEPNVRQAWDIISEITDIGDKTQKSVEVSKIWKVLSESPYGYNELTFTILFSAWLAFHRSEVELSGAFGIPKNKKETVSVKTASLHEWAQTNILEKPKEFVSLWVLRGKNQIIRREPLDISVPDSVSYTDASSLLERISGHIQSGTLEAAKVTFLEKKKQQIQQGVDSIDTWNQPNIEAQQQLEQQASLDVLASYYAPLENTPPSITIIEGVTIVRVSEDQSANWRRTRQLLKNKIEGLVEDLSKAAKNFETTEQGQRLTTDIEHQLERLLAVPELPDRFSNELRAALESAAQQTINLQQLAQKRSLIEQIQRLHQSLTDNATQSQYSEAITRIVTLAATIPQVQQESVYLEIVADIEGKQDVLIRKIDAWEGEFAAIKTTDEALQLSEQINRERNRFDSETNQQQVDSLISRIQARILQQDPGQCIEEELAAVVQKSRQKLESVISLNNFNDVVQTYIDLSQLALPDKVNAANIESYRQQLQESQSEGEKTIRQKLKQLCQDCDREIKRTEEYEQLKGYIVRAQRLVKERAELADEQENLQAARQTLESRYANLQKDNEDRATIKDVQQFRPGMGNTILRCEEIVERIEELRSQLNFPENHADTTDRLITAFKGKRAEYTFSLDDLEVQLQSIETENKLQQLRNDLSKLEFVFKDSTEYSRYRALEDQLQTLSSDLGKVASLEADVTNADSISSIQKALATIDEVQPNLQDLDRFRTRLAALTEALTQKQKQFTDELTQWEQDLSYLSSMSAARKVQSKVVSGATRYKGSQYAEVYDAVRTDISQLTELLTITDTQKVDSIEACQSEIKRLEDWKADQELLSETVEQRLQSIEQSLLKTQQSIETRQRNAAQKWLIGLQDENSQLQALSALPEKLEKASATLKKISSTRVKYENFLEDAQKDALAEVLKACQLVQNQNRASKIETLFQELPKDERIELYQRLSAYLDNTTEVF